MKKSTICMNLLTIEIDPSIQKCSVVKILPCDDNWLMLTCVDWSV